VDLYLYFPYISPLHVLSGAEVENEWSYTSTSSVFFLVVDMNNFTGFFFCSTIHPETVSSHLCSVLPTDLYRALLTGLFQKCVA